MLFRTCALLSGGAEVESYNSLTEMCSIP